MISRIAVIVGLLAICFSASADIDKVQKWNRRADRLRASCGAEVKKFCSTVANGKEQYRCIFLKQSQLSPVCQSFVASIRQKIAAHKARERLRTPASTPPKTGS